MAPLDLLGRGPGVDGALEVDVVVFLQVGGVQGAAQSQLEAWGV